MHARTQKIMGSSASRSDMILTPHDVGGGGSGVATYRDTSRTSRTTVNPTPSARSPSPMWGAGTGTNIGGGGGIGGGNTARSQVVSGQLNVERGSMDSLQWSSRISNPPDTAFNTARKRSDVPPPDHSTHADIYHGGLSIVQQLVGIGGGMVGGGREGGEKVGDTPRSGRTGGVGGGRNIEDALSSLFASPQHSTPYVGPHYHVLVVDDSALTRKVIPLPLVTIVTIHAPSINFSSSHYSHYTCTLN